jgi:hypothetical protein
MLVSLLFGDVLCRMHELTKLALLVEDWIHRDQEPGVSLRIMDFALHACPQFHGFGKGTSFHELGRAMHQVLAETACKLLWRDPKESGGRGICPHDPHVAVQDQHGVLDGIESCLPFRNRLVRIRFPLLAVANVFDRLTNKLFHVPLESLRQEYHHGVPTALLQSLGRQPFSLGRAAAFPGLTDL